jgi:hypothetical protein
MLGMMPLYDLEILEMKGLLGKQLLLYIRIMPFPLLISCVLELTTKADS